jgi:hypothetical protein
MMRNLTDYTPREREILLAGGLLNHLRGQHGNNGGQAPRRRGPLTASRYSRDARLSLHLAAVRLARVRAQFTLE